jgi:hypothetical protein
MGSISQSVFWAVPSQYSQMFVCKAGAYPSEAPYWCYTLWLAPGLEYKRSTLLEWPARNKHSSLLGPLVSYKANKVLRIRPLEACSQHFLYMGPIS